MLKIQSGRPDVRVALPGDAAIVFKFTGASVGVAAGRRAAGLIIEAGGDDATASVAFTIALAKWGAVSWEGIGDADGEPLPLTPDNLELLMSEVPDAYTRIDREFVIPLLTKDAEKNASAPAPNGDTPVRARTAKSAKRGAGATSAPPATASAPSARTP